LPLQTLKLGYGPAQQSVTDLPHLHVLPRSLNCHVSGLLMKKVREVRPSNLPYSCFLSFMRFLEPHRKSV